jgi:opacity protein-like surface antigen
MLRTASLVGALLIPAIAVAQPTQGFYIGGAGGANFAGTVQSSGDSVEVDTSPGPLGLVDLGWGFGDGLRAEVEGSYRSNGIDNISTLRLNGGLSPLSDAGGSLATYAAMANVAYDLPFSNFGLPLQPYIGAGIGYARLQFINAGGNEGLVLNLPGNNTFTGPGSVSYGSGGAFAYQAIAGVSLPLHILPGLAVTLEYRYFGTGPADVPARAVADTTNLVNGAVPSGEARRGFELNDNAVLIGVRYQF